MSRRHNVGIVVRQDCYPHFHLKEMNQSGNLTLFLLLHGHPGSQKKLPSRMLNQHQDDDDDGIDDDDDDDE